MFKLHTELGVLEIVLRAGEAELSATQLELGVLEFLPAGLECDLGSVVAGSDVREVASTDCEGSFHVAEFDLERLEFSRGA